MYIEYDVGFIVLHKKNLYHTVFYFCEFISSSDSLWQHLNLFEVFASPEL